VHLSRGDAFSALDAGMAAVKLAARAVEEEEEEERREEAEAREEKERAVTVAVENGERGGLANSLSPPPISLSRPWRLVARTQAALNKHWASAAAWRQAARLTEDEESARGDEARAAEQDAAATADAAARYG